MERDTIKETIGRRIQAIREERGETQQMLADALGVDRQVVKTWECATRHVKAPDLLALADHYDCTVDYLLGRDENPTRDTDLQAMCHYTGLSEVSLNRLNYEFNQEHTGDVFIDVLDYILRDYTMRDIGKLVYDAVCLRDLSKDLPIDYVEQGIDWANSHELPAGFDIVEAPKAKEFSVEHAAFVLRDAINRFVEMWHGHETYRAEMLQREKAWRDSVMALYEKHNPSGTSEEEEHGEHR